MNVLKNMLSSSLPKLKNVVHIFIYILTLFTAP